MELLDFVFQDVVDQTEPCFQFTTLHLAGCLFSVVSSSGTLPFKTHPFHLNGLIFTICLLLFDGPPSTPSHPQVSPSIPPSLSPPLRLISPLSLCALTAVMYLLPGLHFSSSPSFSSAGIWWRCRRLCRAASRAEDRCSPGGESLWM